MARNLSSLAVKHLLLLYRRSFGTEAGGRLSESLVCKGRKMAEPEEKKCHLKESNYPGNSTDCPTIDWNKCSEPDIKPPPYLSCCHDQRLNENICEKPKNKTPPKREEKPFISMWETCGIQTDCPNLNERLDETHYKSSDKVKRVYTQTWKSCEPIRIRKRKICPLNKISMLPPLKKRAREEYPQTAREEDSEQLKLEYDIVRKCLDNVVENPNTKRINKCRKVVMPCCRKVAKNLKCHRHRRHSVCAKNCCPQPSFSECDHFALRQTPPVECSCLQFVNQCETDRFLARKKMFQLPPALPAWPPKERPK